MELQGRTAIVVGLGKSGLATVRFLASRDAKVRVNDRRDALALGAAADEARALGSELVLGEHPPAAFDDVDLVVVSPGVPPLDVLSSVCARGVPVISEVELASRFIDAPIVAVTGTNGKSTVTTLIGEMCRSLGRPIFVGGNLGDPMIEAVGTDAAKKEGLVVVELSSFQLERVEKMKAHVAVLLNVSPDHLDRYASLDAYAAAKGRIFERQGPTDFAIVPDASPELRDLVCGAARVETFGAPNGGVRIEGDDIVDSENGIRVRVAELELRGSHNLSNACAAWLAARAVGVPVESVVSALRAFRGLPHRMQYVATLRDVEYIDDSKATNVGAAVASIAGFEGRAGKVVLIAGGVDKGGSYEPLRESMDRAGRALVVLGESARLLEKAFAGSPAALEHATSMKDAVRRATALASPGDTVLLAPACSSFDMFRSYAERGDAFQEAVHDLGGPS